MKSVLLSALLVFGLASGASAIEIRDNNKVINSFTPQVMTAYLNELAVHGFNWSVDSTKTGQRIYRVQYSGNTMGMIATDCTDPAKINCMSLEVFTLFDAPMMYRNTNATNELNGRVTFVSLVLMNNSDYLMVRNIAANGRIFQSTLHENIGMFIGYANGLVDLFRGNTLAETGRSSFQHVPTKAEADRYANLIAEMQFQAIGSSAGRPFPEFSTTD